MVPRAEPELAYTFLEWPSMLLYSLTPSLEQCALLHN
jgi:hypothetical protein